MNHIIPTAEPFFIPAGPTGCLLIHGFTGSPKEMRWMGEYLAREGISMEMAYATGSHRSALFVSGLVLMAMIVALAFAADFLASGRVRAHAHA